MVCTVICRDCLIHFPQPIGQWVNTQAGLVAKPLINTFLQIKERPVF